MNNKMQNVNADGVLCFYILMSSIFYDMQLLKIARIFSKNKKGLKAIISHSA